MQQPYRRLVFEVRIEAILSKECSSKLRGSDPVWGGSCYASRLKPVFDRGDHVPAYAEAHDQFFFWTGFGFEQNLETLCQPPEAQRERLVTAKGATSYFGLAHR